MFRTIDDFMAGWKYEAAATQKMFDALIDASLGQAVGDGHRTIGRLAWHMAASIPGMVSDAGLEVAKVEPLDTPPSSAAVIQDAYKRVAASLAEQVKAHWDDATLEVTDNMYGEIWPRGKTLLAVILHQAHHRGQLSVLMRQAGLAVSGPYGPAKEEWAAMGIPDPWPAV